MCVEDPFHDQDILIERSQRSKKNVHEKLMLKNISGFKPGTSTPTYMPKPFTTLLLLSVAHFTSFPPYKWNF